MFPPPVSSRRFASMRAIHAVSLRIQKVGKVAMMVMMVTAIKYAISMMATRRMYGRPWP